MPITLEQLDDDGKENNITILIGKTILLKFTPGSSVFFSEKQLQNLIKTPDLLCSARLKTVIETKDLSEEIAEKLSEAVKFQELVIKSFNEVADRLLMQDHFKKTKQDIIRLGQEIKTAEEKENFHISKTFPLFFCTKCDSYLSNSTDSLLENCKICNTKTDENSPTHVRFIDAKIISYLNGFWLEDYIAKILTQLTQPPEPKWKAWCHGSVMGSSGVYHPIDVLAVNSEGQILVAECKSGAFGGKDIFNFTAQYFDIKGLYGFFFALKEVPDPKGKDYMMRTPGLCLLDNLEGLSDNQLIEKIKGYLKVL